MINYEDYESEVRYRSKKKKPRPKKADHRHEFEMPTLTENADSLAELIMHLVHAVEFAVG